MPSRDSFSTLHPLVGFLYFGLVLLFSMCLMHPACLGISLCSALAYCLYLRARGGGIPLRFVLPVMLLAAGVNAAFNHQGATILTYLPGGNPLTLESLLYGFSAAAMLAAVLLWFTGCSAVMTSDKFIYLFGRVIPALSLLLSMTLRFIPRFTAQLRAVRQARCGLGQDMTGRKPLRRLRNAAADLSAAVTWSLESALSTADSMKARGYGLPGRTAFTPYRFGRRDRAVLLWLGFCGGYVISGWAAGGLYFRYYPTCKWAELTPFSLSFLLVYLALCLTPLIFNAKEARAWKSSQSAT